MVRDAFVAIADPTRREILELLLRHDTVPAGEIAEQFPNISRPAVSRHLRVLRECGVVFSVRRGKARHYVLDPRPIEDIRRGWMEGFARRQTRSLARLRAQVEQSEEA